MSNPEAFWTNYRQWLESYTRLFKTWTDDLGKAAQEAKAQTSEETLHSAYRRFYELTLGPFQNLLNQLTGITPFGPMKTFYTAPIEVQERFLKSIEAYVGFYKDWLDLATRIQTGWTAATSKVQGKIGDLSKELPTADAHRKFYEMWVETLEKEFDLLFKDEHFAASMGRMMDSSLEWRKKNEELTETYLRTMHIPTKKDIDEVYKELSQLRREFRSFRVLVKGPRKKNSSGGSK